MRLGQGAERPTEMDACATATPCPGTPAQNPFREQLQDSEAESGPWRAGLLMVRQSGGQAEAFILGWASPETGQVCKPRPACLLASSAKKLTCNGLIEGGSVLQVFVLLEPLRALAQDAALLVRSAVASQGPLQETGGQAVLLVVVMPHAQKVVLLQRKRGLLLVASGGGGASLMEKASPSWHPLQA